MHLNLNLEWIHLHYEILYAKYIYYKGVRYGFKPISDEQYDLMEIRYKELCFELNKEPEAISMVGWRSNPTLEALAMRNYNKNLYESIKHLIFKFEESEHE